MIDIGLMTFVIVVICNIAALLIDVMLVNTGQKTISDIALANRVWGILIILVQLAGSIGLAVHIL